MTNTDTMTKEISFGDILKDNLAILTGVGKKGEWARVVITGDYEKARVRNRAFDYDFVAMLRQCGVKEISTCK